MFNNALYGLSSQALRGISINEILSEEREDRPCRRDFESLLSHTSVCGIQEALKPILKTINHNYQATMARDYDYRINLKNHILRSWDMLDWMESSNEIYQDWDVYIPLLRKERKISALAGFFPSAESDIFVVSHFSPSSLRGGVDLLQTALLSKMPIIMATLDKQADMLRKLYWREIGTVPQYWDGELVFKRVMANYAVTSEDLHSLFQYWTEE